MRLSLFASCLQDMLMEPLGVVLIMVAKGLAKLHPTKRIQVHLPSITT